MVGVQRPVIAVHPGPQPRPRTDERRCRQREHRPLTGDQAASAQDLQQLLEGSIVELAVVKLHVRDLAECVLRVRERGDHPKQQAGNQCLLLGSALREHLLRGLPQRGVIVRPGPVVVGGPLSRGERSVAVTARQAEKSGEQGGGGRAVGCVLGEGSGDQWLELRRQPVQVRPMVEDLVGESGEVVSVEGDFTGGGEQHDRAPGPDVNGRCGSVSPEQFGSHPTGSAFELVRGAARHFFGAGDPEVDDAWPVGSDEDIGRLEVTVHDPGLMDRRQRRDDPDGQSDELLSPVRSLLVDPALQVGSSDVLADQVGRIVDEVSGDDPCGAEGRDSAECCDLTSQLVAIGVGQVVGVQRLDRDPFTHVVVPLVHHALPTRAEASGQPVRAELARVARCQWRCHKPHPPFRDMIDKLDARYRPFVVGIAPRRFPYGSRLRSRARIFAGDVPQHFRSTAIPLRKAELLPADPTDG